MPRTLGHEIAGIVSAIGPGVDDATPGDRVAIHYLKSCGSCNRCVHAGEQFCSQGQMIGKHCDGGYAETIVVPAANLVKVPDSVPLDAAAVMMCSTATSYHALRLAGLRPGATVALLGFGGLGYSALRLSVALGAERVVAVDVVPEKLDLASRLGAVPADATAKDFATRLGQPDVVLDFVGRPATTTAALRALAPGGTLVLVALSEASLELNPYRDVLCDERRIIGSSDHLRSELVELMALAASGRIDIRPVISRRIPLDAAAINAALDDLDRGTTNLRTVIAYS
jgi:propanol-preferring alcohol dehydrogenase